MVTVRVRSVMWFTAGLALALAMLWTSAVWRAEALPGSSESTVVSVTPERILDSRDGNDVGLPGPLVSAVSQKLQVTGEIPTATGTKAVVPTGATGVLLNVTSVGSTADGFISVRPGDATGAPSTSSLNFTAGATSPNAVQVTLPTTGPNAGKIDIVYDALGTPGPTTDVLVDVVGYTTNAGLQDVNSELAQKADSSDVYTKDEVDSALDALRATPINLSNDGVFDGEIVVVPGFGEIGLSCNGPELSVVWKNTTGEVETIGGPNDDAPLADVAAGAQVTRPDIDLDGPDLGYFLMSVSRASGPIASIVGWADLQVFDCVLQAQAITS